MGNVLRLNRLVWGVKKRMEIIKKGNKIIVEHILKKDETYRISEGRFSSISFFKKPQIVKGYSNVCGDGKAIITIDYDGVSKQVIIDDFKYLQEIFDLPPAYVFKTKENNFHVVCLRKFFPVEVSNIIRRTRCDEKYKTMPSRNFYRSYILRLSNKKGSKKPKFIGIIGEIKNLDYSISSAHFKLLNKLYKLKKIDYQFPDGLSEIKFQEYETG